MWRISDIELEVGELVNEILVGDATRWLVESGVSGGGTTHIFVKPLEAGLQTSLVVTTDKRVYHLKLISKEHEFTPRIGFFVSGTGQNRGRPRPSETEMGHRGN